MSRFRDPRYFIFNTVPSEDDINIKRNKLPTRKEVLLAFICRKEKLWETDKTKKCLFKAATLIVEEQIIPIYNRARIPLIANNKMAQNIMKLYEDMRSLLKIPAKRRDSGKPKERIDNYKESLEKRCHSGPAML